MKADRQSFAVKIQDRTIVVSGVTPAELHRALGAIVFNPGTVETSDGEDVAKYSITPVRLMAWMPETVLAAV